MVASDINRGKVVEGGKKSEGGKNGNKKDFLRKKHRFLGRSVAELFGPDSTGEKGRSEIVFAIPMIIIYLYPPPFHSFVLPYFLSFFPLHQPSLL